MKILFVCSGTQGTPSTLVHNQAESLRAEGHHVSFFLVKEKGLKGYLKAYSELRSYSKSQEFDIVHAHYGISAIMATLASRKRIVVSLMGSDLFQNRVLQILLQLFHRYCWKPTIVKSQQMAETLGKGSRIIPNGVDMERFKEIDKVKAKSDLGLDFDAKIILFGSSPKRPEKNYALAKESFDLLNVKKVELLCLEEVPFDKIPFYLNSSEVLLLTSRWEGSPNIIKEAMSCNLPIVSTDVGDVRWLLNGLEGCFISGFEASSIAGALTKALQFATSETKTKGRDRLLELGLEISQVATQIISVYEERLNLK